MGHTYYGQFHNFTVFFVTHKHTNPDGLTKELTNFTKYGTSINEWKAQHLNYLKVSTCKAITKVQAVTPCDTKEEALLEQDVKDL